MRFGRRFALAAILCVAAGCDDGNGSDGGVKVATFNLYLGADVGPLLAAPDPYRIPELAAEAFGQLVASNFPERAEAVADRVAAQPPHLIGLQEVSLIRRQSPSADGPAEEVFLDYLQILLDALAARGLDYRVAGKIQNVDVELPMLASVDPPGFDDVRLTDFDVVLARGDVDVSNVTTASFSARLFVESLNLEIPRGYVAVDASWGGRSVRFASTHLEDLPFKDVQLAQAAELAAALAAETKPVILVGDFNSPAPAGETCELLDAAGFQDAWLRNIRRDEGEGLTWGHDADLRNPDDAFTLRIDLVWVRPGRTARLGTVAAEVWGDEPVERTPSGLWPSDHAAVIAWLELPERRPSKP